jgi:glycerate kinase
LGLKKNLKNVYIMDYGVAEVVNRVIKYLIEGLVVAAAAIYIPKKSLPMEEVATLAVLAAVVFAILDAVSPSIGVTARQGAGFGLGANLVGFPMRR